MVDPVERKLADHNQIIDLKLTNLAKSIKLEIQETLLQAHKHLEDRIDKKIKETVQTQKDKVSWGIEVVRLGIMAVMFIISIKVIGNA
jgi:hypothetical protein